jgi:uncharacterized protein YjhX (UPF0386 family)
MAKLTKAQRDLLIRFADWGGDCPFRGGIYRYAPFRRLLRRRAIERGSRKPFDDWVYYRITPAGLAALKAQVHRA